jgi:asparagine synthase (glutamine-hydrolysing)
LIADVPVGLFLSGGIDSSLIAALAAKVTNGAVQSYTVGFTNKDFDESTYATRVAETLGIENHRLMAEDDVLVEASAVARQFDEPFGDSSALPTWLVSKLARRHVTVALTGDGGDELFAGYESFRQALRIWGHGAQRRLFRRPLSLPERLWEWKLRMTGFEKGHERLEQSSGWRARHEIFSDAFRARNSVERTYEDRYRLMAEGAGTDLLSRMQRVVFNTWLPDDFLRKVDTASMAHSLECRSPLLDYRIMEFAAHLPFEAKFAEGGRGKRIVRDVLARYIPRELFDRPKQGFSIPWEQWCTGSVSTELRDRWARQAPKPFRREAAGFIFPDEGIPKRFLQWLAFCALEQIEN